jgi:copper chaperone CopZ
MHRVSVPFLAVSLAISSLATAETRVWTQAATGKTIEGELRQVDGDRARIARAGGVEVVVPLAMLAEADREFIAAWQAKANAPKLPEGPVDLVLADAHLCCGGCRNAVTKAGSAVEGVTVTTEGSNIRIAAPDAAKALEAVAAVHQAGYYGVPSIEAFADRATYPAEKTKSADLTGIHLCCGKCVSSAQEAIESVAGVAEISGLDKGASTVTVTGEFSKADLAKALHDAGFHAGGLN